MAGGDIIMMNQEELKRVSVIHKVIDKELTQIGASGMLTMALMVRNIRSLSRRRINGLSIARKTVIYSAFVVRQVPV